MSLRGTRPASSATLTTNMLKITTSVVVLLLVAGAFAQSMEDDDAAAPTKVKRGIAYSAPLGLGHGLPLLPAAPIYTAPRIVAAHAPIIAAPRIITAAHAPIWAHPPLPLLPSHGPLLWHR